MNQSCELIDVIACENILGEGIQWNADDGAFWWTDILSKTLFRYHAATGLLDTYPLPFRLASFAFATQDARLLCAFDEGFAWYDLTTQAVEWIAKPEATVVGNRSNDGRCDRAGNFLMGTVVDDAQSPDQFASLYRLTAQGHVETLLTSLRISNAVCFSPDGKTLYHADSPTHEIKQYPYDATTGHIGAGSTFIKTDERVEPDGACIDAEGHLWNAQWGGSRVARYSPKGELVDEIVLPITQPTCVAFGGEHLNLLAVTSARKGLNDIQLTEQPLAGNVFIFATPYPGLKESRFKA